MAEKKADTLSDLTKYLCSSCFSSNFLSYSTCLLIRLQPEGGGYRHVLLYLDSVVSLIGN